MEQRHWLAKLFFLTIFISSPALSLEPGWTLSFDGPVAGKAIAHGQEIIVAGGNKLISLDPGGSETWETVLEGSVLSTPVLADDRIIVHTTSGLTALDSSGESIWHHEAEDKGALVDGRTWGWGDQLLGDPWAYYRSSPLVTENAVVFANSGGIRALNPENGEVIWQQPTASVTADLVGFEDGVIAADWNNSLRRFSLEDGTVEWTFKANNPRSPYAEWIGWTGLNLSPVISEGQVLLGGRGTYFYAVNAQTGKETWANKHGTSWIGSAATVHEQNVYFGLSDGKAIIGINILTGNQSMFVPTSGPVFATPVVVDNHLIAGTLQGEILVVDLESAELVLNHRLHDSQKPYGSYFQPDPESGLSPYEFTVQQMGVMKDEQKSILSLAVIDDELLVGTGSGELLAFSLNDLINQ